MTDPTCAALSQPEPAGLSDEELMELMPQQFRDDLATVSRMAAHGAGPDVGAGLFRVSLNTGALEFARTAIAADRAQRQPVPPEPGEVQELVKWLREQEGRMGACAMYSRIADLLAQRYPQPVPVSERLPDNRDPECVANWPECWSGGYDPRCCRFPKSCSCERGALPLPGGVNK